MILSSLLTPFRIYDQYHDLDKFKKDCQGFCNYELITDKTRLLPFQFHRPASAYTFSKIWMRPACVGFYTQIVPENESMFISDGYFAKTNFVIQNGYAKTNGAGSGSLSKTITTPVGTKVYVKIVTSDISVASGNSFAGDIFINGSILGSAITAAVHVFSFMSTGSDLVALQTVVMGSDYLKFSEFKIYYVNAFSSSDNGDVLLDIPFDLVNAGTTDIVSYCGSKFDNTLPCGIYYLIFYSNNGVYLFSEVFTVKNFLPEQSPYVLLEWANPCDLQNVKFTGFRCGYINRLYIDGPITTPEYPFKEEGEEDGNQSFNATFQKWEKEETIIVPKAPQYLVDALTAIRLHENIIVYDRLRYNQIQITEYVEIKSLTYDVDYIINDCAANVKLKVLLNERVVDSSCCSEIPVTECIPCDYAIGAFNDFEPSFGVALSDQSGTIKFYEYDSETEEWAESAVAPGASICMSDGKRYYYNGTNYILMPDLNAIVDNGAGFTGPSFTISGNFLSNTFVELTIVFNGTTVIYPVLYTAANLLTGVTILYSSVPIVPECGTMTVTARSFTIGCEYGISNTRSITWSGPEC